jgi:hypothetical protein
MLVIGSLLALFVGVANSVAAALEKHESMAADPTVGGLRLLGRLARRPVWLTAMGLSALSWIAEAASLGTAPVPVVATLRSSGRGLLVVGGRKWLGETFGRLELTAVTLATVGGVVTAVGATGSTVSHAVLSLPVQAGVAGGSAALAFVVSRLANGVAMGAAVGVLFAGTGVFTKQISDLFATRGLGAVEPILASLTLWAMIAMSVWAQNLLQGAFRKANAASVAAANAAVASLGLMVAGFLLYGERFPTGWAAGPLVGGIVVSLVGTVLLAMRGGRVGEEKVAAAVEGAEAGPPGGDGGQSGAHLGDGQLDNGQLDNGQREEPARRPENQRRNTAAHWSPSTPGTTSNS